jgi:RNA polymerase sigma-70 factor (ECF subfamily)
MQATIEAAIKGDVDAQTKIVDEYSERIFNLGLHLLKNEHDAEDMLQETFIKVFEHLPNFEGRANLYTWIYRIATNIALMKLRRGGRETLVDDFLEKYDYPEPLHMQNSIPTPMGTVLDAELEAELKAALQRLPEIYRTVFMLRDIEGLSTRETAEAMEISENNVKIRLKRARAYLREELCTYFDNCQSA